MPGQKLGVLSGSVEKIQAASLDGSALVLRQTQKGHRKSSSKM